MKTVFDDFVLLCVSQPVLAFSIALVLVALIAPEVFDQFRGVGHVLVMHWSRYWSQASRGQALDPSDFDSPDDGGSSNEDSDPKPRSRPSGSETRPSAHTFPGLLNAGGNACFLNAAVQSLASVDLLVPYLRGVMRLASLQHDSAPVTAALLAIVTELNRPSTSKRVFQPHALASALFNSSQSRRQIMNAEQQDAHEFFVMLTEAISDELEKLERGSRQASETASFGLQSIESEPVSPERLALKDPFESLMARRLSCVSCRYTENVVHYHENHLTLNVPFVRSCDLLDMLDDYVKLDLIDERVCTKCSLRATIGRLESELSKADEASAAFRKRRNLLAKLRATLTSGQYDVIEQTALDRAERPATKQAMFGRPPSALAIHLVRSSAYRNGIPIKNSCRVKAPAVLDLAPYMTGAALNTRPESSMGVIKTDQPTAPTHRYTLVSVVEHYGSHSYGHYVAHVLRKGHWFNISDEQVYPASLDDALWANPFLLFYAKCPNPEPTPISRSPSSTVPRLVQRHSTSTRSSSIKEEMAELVKLDDGDPTVAT